MATDKQASTTKSGVGDKVTDDATALADVTGASSPKVNTSRSMATNQKDATKQDNDDETVEEESGDTGEPSMAEEASETVEIEEGDTK